MRTRRWRCSARHAMAATSRCVLLAMSYEDGDGVAQDAGKAVALYQKACDAGEASGCNNLAVMYKRGHGIPANAAKAAVFRGKACDRGELGNCEILARAYEAGDGVARDFSKAAALYQKVCDGGSDGTYDHACFALGQLYERGGAGITKDVARAISLYQRTCDGRDSDGCTALGILYTQGPKKDEATAAKLFRKACDNFAMAACYNLGQLYSVGPAALHDTTKAAARSRRAVERRKNDKGDALVLDMKACNASGELYVKAMVLRRTPRSPQRCSRSMRFGPARWLQESSPTAERKAVARRG